MADHVLSSYSPHRAIYPSAIEQYQQCARRFYFQRVARHPSKSQSSPAIAKGNATHNVLKLCGEQLRRTGDFPKDIRQLVSVELARHPELSDEWRADDIKDLTEWVEFGLAAIDRHAQVLGVEQFAERPIRLADGSRITFGAKLDLVLLRIDQNGESFIEVVDYKSGKNLDQAQFPPVLARFVLKRQIDQHLQQPVKGRFGKIYFTEIYLFREELRRQEMTRERCDHDWDALMQVVSELVSNREWKPTPSPMCEGCPYLGNPCEVHAFDGSEELW